MGNRKPVSDAEREKLFKIWLDAGRNMAEVKRRSKRSKDTVYRIRREDDWEGRAAKLARNRRQVADQKILAEDVSNLKRATELLPKVLEKLEKNLGEEDYRVRVRDVTELMRYIDELGGVLPDSNLEGLLARVSIDIKDPGDVRRALENCLAGFSLSGPKTRGDLDKL